MWCHIKWICHKHRVCDVRDTGILWTSHLWTSRKLRWTSCCPTSAPPEHSCWSWGCGWRSWCDDQAWKPFPSAVCTSSLTTIQCTSRSLAVLQCILRASAPTWKAAWRGWESEGRTQHLLHQWAWALWRSVLGSLSRASGSLAEIGDGFHFSYQRPPK